MKLKLIFVISVFTLIIYVLSPGKPGEILIKPNSTSATIAHRLKSAHIIRSKLAFLILTRITGTTKKLKSGYYSFNRDWLFTVLWKIYSGKTTTIKITIPEGLTAEEIARRINQQKLKNFSQKDFLILVNRHKLEGQLFPATYNFPPDITTRELLSQLTNQFYLNFTKVTKNKKIKLSDRDILTLASIVEKETADQKERKIIADIFYRRLKKKIPLESCATVIYALKQKDPQRKINHLTYQDTKIFSPYNTYRHYGLPPGPICNPGLDSINAVLNPEENDYWYFFVSSSGSHIFSHTYQEHQQNQKKWK